MPLFHRSQRAPQTDIDPHYWELPTSYSPRSKDKPTVIPNPRIFSNAATPIFTDSDDLESILHYPDASHAAVHLALLECFRKLRLSASALDVKVDQPPEYHEKNSSTASSTGPARLPESERWNLLINLAVTRFGVWWSKIHLVFTHVSAYANHGGRKAQIQLTEAYLPPIDVLLVWYAFMLDSDSYRTACHDLESVAPGVSSLCFPWAAIRASIDMESMVFQPTRSAQKLFFTLSGQFADILTYLEGPPAYSEEPVHTFPLDLFAEVKKHEPFLDEAHALLWIRSPALQGSLERSASGYVNYQLAERDQMDPEAPLVFGVRLYWKTHRLYPRLYEAFLRETGETDGARMEGGAKDDSVKQTPSLQQPPCHCWTCERIRDEIPDFAHTPVTSPAAAASSSNSVPSAVKQKLSSVPASTLRQIKDDLGFYNAVEKARSRGQQLPTRPPTEAELEAERIAKQRQDRVGYLPGINEYVEVLPDGSRKIRRNKYANAWKGLSWAV